VWQLAVISQSYLFIHNWDNYSCKATGDDYHTRGKILVLICMSSLIGQEWINMKDGFKKHKHFFNCIQAVDSRHV
jgi:hypothetical protein